MAGIDKTYINRKDYHLYRQWWIDNYNKMIEEFGYPIWLYPFSAFGAGSELTPMFLKNNMEDIKRLSYKNFPVWNTSEDADKWLIKNCNISSYQERLKEVYSSDWEGFK